jgi:flotillin
MGESMFYVVGVGVLGLVAFFAAALVPLLYRIVVPTNEVHIVQSSKATVSYGKDTGNGNTYYKWPSWIPKLGVTRVILPTSVFDLDLSAYEAYDKGRLPFVVDVKAFFRITDSNVAAARIASFEELNDQLKDVVQGAVRTILASSEIEEIMQGRSKFGKEFTDEVSEHLKTWGVAPVKNLELMDIRDSKDSVVIRNIMEKKKSQIEKESRVEVAKNKQLAQTAEIEAQQQVDLHKQNAAQSVGLRTVEAQRQVEIAQQEKTQAIKEQERLTKEKEMAVFRVAATRQAELEREASLVKADQDKQTTILEAEATLEAKRRDAEAIRIQGEARASAEKAIQLAPVEAQIVLAKEIGSNESYQKYLVTIKQVEASQAVGMEQAKALEKADVKIISNSSGPVEGLNSVLDLFSSGGGMKVGAMLEGLSQTDAGKALLTKAGIGSETKSS